MARAASGTVALAAEAEALRAECTQLEARAAAMRAQMATLASEVDLLSAADKRADAELQAAKARHCHEPAARGKGRPLPTAPPRGAPGS